MTTFLTGFSPEASQRRRRAIILVAVAVIGTVVILVGLFDGHAGHRRAVAAGILGALVAIAELVSRYRDEPGPALLSIPAIVYLAVNVGASLAALYLIKTFDWDFGASGSSKPIVQVLTAGFGSAAVFRSSLFNITAGDQTIGIGPSTVLNVILNAADRAVDRERAAIRSARAGTIMKGVGFTESADALLAYVSATMQNLTDAEAKLVRDRIDSLRADRNKDLPDELKSYILGLALMRLTGYKLLRESVRQIKATLPAAEATGSPAQTGAGAGTDDRAAVLRALRDGGGSMSITDLQRRTGLHYKRASRAIDDLESQGVVRRGGEPGAETVEMVH